MGIAAPLRKNLRNPRYFADAEGRAVVLTGFHTWNSLQDIEREGTRNDFDFNLYLDYLSEYGHNFIRLWAWDALCSWDARDRVGPFPWARTGPGVAVDGEPKFDLDVFDEAFFRRLRERVAAAHERGIYVGVMLFESWAAAEMTSTPLDWHVFAGPNNINGVDALATVRDGWMMGWMGLADPVITAIQEHYVERVVRELNGFPNVLYEVSNEAGGFSYAWQQHIVDHVRRVQAGLPNQHLIGVCGGMNTRDAAFFDIDADYLAPEGWAPEGEGNAWRDGQALYGELPEKGDRPIVLDTDHIWGIGGSPRWVWQSFLRGYHVLYMDRCDDLPWAIFEHPWWPDPTDPAVRLELGAVQRAAAAVDLNGMAPSRDFADSGYALVGDGEWLALSLDGAPLNLRLPAGTYAVRWDRVGGPETEHDRMTFGDRAVVRNPWTGDAVVRITSA